MNCYANAFDVTAFTHTTQAANTRRLLTGVSIACLALGLSAACATPLSQSVPLLEPAYGAHQSYGVPMSASIQITVK